MCNSDVGVNYIQACLEEHEGVVDVYAVKAKVAILKVLEGSQQRAQLIYPCHSPLENRWFMMDVNAITGVDHLAVVISHTNISHLFKEIGLVDEQKLQLD